MCIRDRGYTLGDALGEGAFAVCRLGHKAGEPNKKVAVKSLMRNHPNFDLEALASEIKIMKAINHPRCISLIEVREDKAAVHLVEELAGGGFCVGVPCDRAVEALCVARTSVCAGRVVRPPVVEARAQRANAQAHTLVVE